MGIISINLKSLNTKMDLRQHRHEWIKQNNYFVCECGKKKLILDKQKQGVSKGVRANGKSYTVRDNRERIFMPDEWKRFFDCLKPSQRFTFELLLNIGARPNEARHIKIEDIDFKNQRLILKVTKHRKEDIHKSHSRTIRFSSKLSREIKRNQEKYKLNNNDYIKILSTSAANIAMKKALQKANIKDWYMFAVYCLRKTSETWALSLGIDSLILSKRYGHNLTTMYQHYSQSDTFNYKEKEFIKDFFGDTFLEL